MVIFFRNEVAREKKQLINQIRKRYLKSLKAESVKGQSGRREVAILQILKEADSEGVIFIFIEFIGCNLKLSPFIC